MSGQGKNEASPGVAKTSSPSLRMAPISGSPTGRLPSFKPPRDLTLGSFSRPPVAGPAGRGVRSVPGLQQDAGKKKFVPNLNVQRRDKTATSEPTKAKAEAKEDSNKKQPLQRNRTSTRPELIQTIGSVFSDGMGSDAAAIRRRFGGSGGGGGDGGSAALERPKINLKSLDTKFDRAAEEERLKELLRDDFIDDLTTGNLVPVQLPMIDTGKVFKEEVNKEDDEDEDELRIMRDGKARVKKSNVILDSDGDDDDVDAAKKVDAEMKDASKPSKSVIKSLKKESAEAAKPELQFTDLVRSQNGDLLFIQLPDHLPWSAPEVKDEAKPEPGSSKPTQSKTQCTLDNLSDGYFGKLQIRSSGRTQLVVGDMTMEVNFGTQVGFLQELVSIDVHQPQQEQPGQRATGDISVLGRVRHRLVVTPDWGKLFSVESSPDPEVDSSDEEADVKKT